MELEIETKKCPFCAETINAAAVKCKHCGEYLDEVTRKANRQQSEPTIVLTKEKIRRWSPGIAALLSLILPGAGHIYKGHIIAGLVWMFFVVVGYILLIIPGLILHLICIFYAASGDPYRD